MLKKKLTWEIVWDALRELYPGDVEQYTTAYKAGGQVLFLHAIGAKCFYERREGPAVEILRAALKRLNEVGYLECDV